MTTSVSKRQGGYAARRSQGELDVPSRVLDPESGCGVPMEGVLEALGPLRRSTCGYVGKRWYGKVSFGRPGRAGDIAGESSLVHAARDTTYQMPS